MQAEDLLLAQYEECLEDLREYGRLIWQGVSVSLTVSVGLATTALAFLQLTYQRSVVVFVAGLFNFAFSWVVMKYRYHSVTRAESAMRLEDKLELKRIQRRTKREGKKEDYWYTHPPNWIERSRISGHELLVAVMFVISFVLMGLGLVQLFLPGFAKY